MILVRSCSRTPPAPLRARDAVLTETPQRLGDLLEPDAAVGAPALAMDGHLEFLGRLRRNPAKNFQIAQEKWLCDICGR